LHPGSSTTTLSAATARSEANPRSADCYQPDGRVHLARRCTQPHVRYPVVRPLTSRGYTEYGAPSAR
jgi:hypothetical protein